MPCHCCMFNNLLCLYWKFEVHTSVSQWMCMPAHLELGSLLCSVCKLATKRTNIRVNTPMSKHMPIGEHLLCLGNDPWPMELNPLSVQLFSYDWMLAHKLLCWDIYTLRSQNELLCSFIFCVCSKILLLCLDMVLFVPNFFLRCLLLVKGGVFWVSTMNHHKECCVWL
jgi:hypothetical protein